MKSKKKRIIIFSVLGFVAMMLVVFIVVVALMFGNQILAVMSIETLEEDFYSMEYEGDYGLDKLIEKGGVSSDQELIDHIVDVLYHDMCDVQVGNSPFGCSTLRATTEEGNVLFGRNYDFEDRKAMVVITEPKNGYKSISTCNLDLLGMDDSWKPDTFVNKMMSLASIYMPVDGMNEKGVCVAVLYVSVGAPTNQNTDKPDLTTTTAVRLILDKASNVDEAIELLEQYDMHASMGGRFKFAIADASGKSVTVEYILNEMSVTEVDATSNFIQTPGSNYGLGIKGPCPRYEKLVDAYIRYNGNMTEELMMSAMESVSNVVANTQWTVVFNTDELTATYCYYGDFDKTYNFKIK